MDRKEGAPQKFTLFHYPEIKTPSPLIHHAFANQFQIKLDYTCTNVAPGTLQQAVSAFRNAGGVGANVTIPLKEEAYALCSEVTPRARIAQSVNTLFWQDGVLWGDNTDGYGLLRDIKENHKLAFLNQSILILGAGGAVCGILGPILAENPRRVVICNRTLSRAQALCSRFDYPLEACDFELLNEKYKEENFDWIINATPAFKLGEILPIDSISFKNAKAYDLTYAKEMEKETPFMAFARERSAPFVSDGIGMLVYEAAERFALWHNGKMPKVEKILNHFKQKLAWPLLHSL